MNILRNNIHKLYRVIMDQVFTHMKLGRLTVSMPDGTKRHYGNGEGPAKAHINIRRGDFFRKCVHYGAVGFGESYVDGDWDTPDLTKVIAWMILNHENLPAERGRNKKFTVIDALSFLNVIRSKFRLNTLNGSRKNISDHYDLGNDFFKLFLDETMTYSSAIFTKPNQSLKDAQVEKYDRLCRQLKLSHQDHVLEIGSGWGGFSCYAAKKYGCRITTTTISQEQYKHVKNKIKKEGLENQIKIKLSDYRRLAGTYDKIVSIEMIEAVGHEFLPTYIKKCQELLKPNGLLGLQMILFPDQRYDIARKNVDWIQKHIFPGSLLPSMNAIQKVMRQLGTMNLLDYKDITSHYAKTLKIWREAFNQNKQKIKSMKQTEEFIRKWNYYWSYCEAAFRMRHINVAQAVFTRSNNHMLHDDLEVELNGKDKQFIEELSYV